MAVAVYVFAIAFTLACVYFGVRGRLARTRAVAALAQQIGFTFSARDVDHTADLPFGLFHRGSGRKAGLVISGVHNKMPMRMFDYEYTVSSGNNRQTHRFTCALLTIPAACPSLQLGHENFFTRLGDHLGLRDVELEYDEFNRRFRVKCNDQKFAFSLLDGKMMQWLIGADGFDSVEIDGPWVLIAAQRLPPARWLELGSWLDQFHNQIPPVVYSTYPVR